MSRLRRFAVVTLAWNLAVILWGAFVRASGSGAGCGAHWPLCNGEVLPRERSVELMIEYTHRATSGLALVMVVALAAWVLRARPRGHVARKAAVASLVLILTEALVGAGLVLFRLVADNESVARALFMAAHLVNTFLLLAALTLTARWADADAPPRPDAVRRDGWAFALAFLALVLVGTSGAVAALGDTLYPARSLLAGLAADLSPTATVLVRLRVLHPMLALLGTLAVALVAGRVLQTVDASAPRRWAWTAAALALLQVGAGLLNVALLAPVWMQILHLLLADLLWIALVLLASHALAAPTTAPARAEAVPA
jgi:heme A synthase